MILTSKIIFMCSCHKSLNKYRTSKLLSFKMILNVFNQIDGVIFEYARSGTCVHWLGM